MTPLTPTTTTGKGPTSGDPPADHSPLKQKISSFVTEFCIGYHPFMQQQKLREFLFAKITNTEREESAIVVDCLGQGGYYTLFAKVTKLVTKTYPDSTYIEKTPKCLRLPGIAIPAVRVGDDVVNTMALFAQRVFASIRNLEPNHHDVCNFVQNHLKAPLVVEKFDGIRLSRHLFPKFQRSLTVTLDNRVA